ncbi:MAG: flap endonuclease-1 [Candidatus Aenigmarchaeota archaeon]|nr:flap endonuclease-1 [Candidatus Aenigmarchaeota archaeon]
MGVNLREIASPQKIEIESLGGRVLALDSLNIIYQFLSIIRDRITGEPLKDSKGNVTSHLSGLFYRTIRIMEAGITPVFVFDGRPPEFKRGTQEIRRQIKEAARENLEKAVREGDREKIRLYSQQTSHVTDEMLSEAKKLLSAMGVQYVEAPSEGEAQASYMNSKGLVYACGSQDWDSLLFGAERLVRNLTLSGRRKLPGKETYISISPEMISLKAMLDSLSITREQLVLAGILVGTDYNPGGVKGIGPKRAVEIVREKKTPESIFSGIEWEFDTPPEKIIDFFMNPPVIDVQIKADAPDAERVREILLGHDFSEERIAKSLEKLVALRNAGRQSSLQNFM